MLKKRIIKKNVNVQNKVYVHKKVNVKKIIFLKIYIF